MPKRLGFSALEPEIIAADRRAAKRFGPCAVGEKALYFGSYFLDCHFYLPVKSVRRVFKRVAMSRGGFDGKGIFGALSYLVAEYDDGKEYQCRVKYEEDADRFLAEVQQRWPQMPTHSLAAERRLAEKAAAEAAKPRPVLDEKAQNELKRAETAGAYLAEHPAEAAELSAAARAKRVNERSNPAYKWVALTIMLGGAVALAYGITMLLARENSGLYFMLFGLAAILFFSGTNVLPTARNNKKAVAARLAQAQAAMEVLANAYPPGLPVPVHYAHPIVLERMAEVLRQGRAETCEAALEVVKADLKSLNASVQVEQEEYDQVVAVKPMFLLADYQ